MRAEDRSIDELSSEGIDPDVVQRAVAMIDRAEYKRARHHPACGYAPRRSAATDAHYQPLARLDTPA